MPADLCAKVTHIVVFLYPVYTQQNYLDRNLHGDLLTLILDQNLNNINPDIRWIAM